MPIFEYICNADGVFEMLLPKHEDFHSCPYCGEICEWYPSLVSMQPDSCWAGVFTPTGQYVTSSRQYKKEMANVVPATRSEIEAVQKNKKRRKLEAEQKKELALEKFLADQLAPVAIDPDYNHLPGKRLAKQRKFGQREAILT